MPRRKRASLPLSDKIDKALIKLVKKEPVLYDYNHEKYLDANVREVTWQKIGDLLKQPAEDCKIRWTNIRDTYRKICKQASSKDGTRSRKYKYEKQVSFLKPYFKDIPQADSNSESSDLDNNMSDSEIKLQKKPKLENVNKSYEMHTEEPEVSLPFMGNTPELDRTDPVDAFLVSIGNSLKTFSPYHLNVAKSKIFSIVQEHELAQIVQKEKYNDDIQFHQ